MQLMQLPNGITPIHADESFSYQTENDQVI